MNQIAKMALGILLAFFLAGAIFAQEETDPQETESQDETIPVMKGVESVTLNSLENKQIVIRYTVTGNDPSPIIKFYKGKKIFGVGIGKIAEDEYGYLSFAKCNKKTQKGLGISIVKHEDPMIVDIRNYCYKKGY